MPRSRRALVVGCALVLGSVTAAPPAVPAENAEASAAYASPWASAAAEARVLAQRILEREGIALTWDGNRLRARADKMMVDGARLRTLGYEIKRVLALIRRAYPAMAEVSAREQHEPGKIVLRLAGELRGAVFDAWNDENESAPPTTAHAGFDALNELLGLRAVQTYAFLDSVALFVDERVNMLMAIVEYRAIDGVANAHPDLPVGDGPDIEAERVDGTWHLVFRKAWGDCPSGCIHSELSFFTVADGEVTRIDPAQARSLDAFASLIAGIGWR